ncbi:ABC transporter permease [Nitriliruptor alkaliphilus]|uniref:ABC transporter permease n=1 Tax=Nitriliruptor alkaliphilus TaxID=427918 RepID=UPI0006983693|nr:ABC transporter permease [Nitriliruptor alkaliphilus]
MVRWWAITWIELVRLFRDRGNIFFVLVFPLLLVVLIGASFGGEGAGASIGVVADDADPAAQRLVGALDGLDGLDTEEVGDPEQLRDLVARGGLRAGVVIPDGFGDDLARGGGAEVAYIGRPDGSGASLRAVVEGVVSGEASITDAAVAAADATGRPFTETAAVAAALADVLPPIVVSATEVAVEDGLAQEFAGLGQFDLGASSQLFLFTFLTATAGGVALIQTRQYGVARRMLSTSTPPLVVLTGVAGGRIGVALFQAAYIVAVTAVVFGVNWGDPVATTAVVLLFCLVAGGAGMLVGATLRNDSQASGVGVGLGLGLAALGGSMAPLEIFPDTIRRVAMVTPHAWANQAMAELVRRDGRLGDVLVELAVLAAFAVVILTAATVLLRRNLTR